MRTIDELYYSVVNFGGDPVIIECDEQAEQLQESIQRSTQCREITDTEEFLIAAKKLDFSIDVLPRRIYSYVDINEFIVCFAEDYGD